MWWGKGVMSVDIIVCDVELDECSRVCGDVEVWACVVDSAWWIMVEEGGERWSMVEGVDEVDSVVLYAEEL